MRRCVSSHRCWPSLSSADPDSSSLISENLSITTPTNRLITKKPHTMMKMIKYHTNMGSLFTSIGWPGSVESTHISITSPHISVVDTSNRVTMAAPMLSNDHGPLRQPRSSSVPLGDTYWPVHSVMLSAYWSPSAPWQYASRPLKKLMPKMPNTKKKSIDTRPTFSTAGMERSSEVTTMRMPSFRDTTRSGRSARSARSARR
mmetsp:Transcript_4678/g.15158  ORF Transcript_4678/g.15158 Transcript_4678/m.15158 type:complete len:202 (-) Transcript_4678:791-1396(-)